MSALGVVAGCAGSEKVEDWGPAEQLLDDMIWGSTDEAEAVPSGSESATDDDGAWRAVLAEEAAAEELSDEARSVPDMLKDFEVQSDDDGDVAMSAAAAADAGSQQIQGHVAVESSQACGS